MNQARITITGELLVKSLHLPEDICILEAQWDAFTNVLHLTIEYPALPIPQVGVRFEPADDGGWQFDHWETPGA